MIKEDCIAIIPARGGSKGLVGKNIMCLHGKPLIAWTIESAKQSKYVTRVIVNTDCEEIAAVALKYGAEVPFLRPAGLASDTATSAAMLIHLIDKLKLENETIVFLQPTSPLRNHIHIDEAYEKFQKDKGESLVSISRLDKSPYWSFWLDGKRLKAVCQAKSVKMRRQELPDAYALNGAIYIFKVSSFKSHQKFILDESSYYLMEKNSSIDIDDLIDFKMVEIILEQK